MKRADFTPCLRCGKQVGHANGLLFYAVTLQRMMFDHRAIQQTAGLEISLRSPVLADVFSPDPELAKPLGEPEKFLLCDACAMTSYPVAALEELAADRRASDAGDADTTVAAPSEPPGTPAPECEMDPPPGEAA